MLTLRKTTAQTRKDGIADALGFIAMAETRDEIILRRDTLERNTMGRRTAFMTSYIQTLTDYLDRK